MRAHVAIDELVEQHFTDRIEPCGGGRRLRHGGESAVVAEPTVELGDGDARQRGDAAVGGRVPVDVHLEQFEKILGAIGRCAVVRFVVAVTGDDLLAARGCSGSAVERGRGDHLEAVARQLRNAGEALRGTRGGTVEHVRAVVCIQTDLRATFVGTADVCVVPHAAMRIVGQRGRRIVVRPPAAGHRVRSLRDIGAEVGVVQGQQEPAAGLTVVQHDRVAAIAGAGAAGRSQRAEGDRTGHQGAGFVIDVEIRAGAAAVDGVDHVVGADFDHRVTGADAGIGIVDADAAADGVLHARVCAAAGRAFVPELLQLGQTICGSSLVGGRMRQRGADRRVLAAMRFADAHAGRPRLGLGQIAQVGVHAVRGDRLSDLRTGHGTGVAVFRPRRYRCAGQQ